MTKNLYYSYTVIGAPCIKFYFLKLYANFLTKSFLSNSFHLNVIADALGKNILTINTEFCNRQILLFSSPFLENKNTFSHKIFTKIVPSQLYSICQNASIANGGVARILNNNNNNNNNDKFSVDILLHSGLREWDCEGVLRLHTVLVYITIPIVVHSWNLKILLPHNSSTNTTYIYRHVLIYSHPA